jgi:hypothetical protein
MNIEVWQLLGEAANGDSRLLSRAILNVVRLDPLTARK